MSAHIGEFDGVPDWSLIPEHMHDGIRAYVETGRPTGSFLTAVLRNDLFSAAERADGKNKRLLYEWVKFLYSYAPSECWGNPHRVDDWLKRGAAAAREAAAASSESIGDDRGDDMARDGGLGVQGHGAYAQHEEMP